MEEHSPGLLTSRRSAEAAHQGGDGLAADVFHGEPASQLQHLPGPVLPGNAHLPVIVLFARAARERSFEDSN